MSFSTSSGAVKVRKRIRGASTFTLAVKGVA